jgi:oligopeptide/dipeptide ABC transporter ATP-binding protein
VTLLAVDALSVGFGPARSRIPVVEGVSFSVEKGETLGLVGESGCGKTVTAMSAIRLLPSPPAHVTGGSVRFDGIDLVGASKAQLRGLWGNCIGVVFQNPMTSLNPVFTIGFQLTEALRLHRPLGEVQAREQVMAMLARVGINAPERRLQQYPHELSGGLRQRVMIAMALICHPELLVADEPTTALDVTLQAQILDLLRSLRDELGMGILMITHDLGVVAEFCDRVAVMYAGRIVETAPVRALFRHPRHPYTRGLMDSIPRMDTPREQALATIEGMVPAPGRRGAGCAFADRCSRAVARCRTELPVLADEGGHAAACWNPVP